MEQREIALKILHKTIKEESYSNLLMRKELNKLPPIQRGAVTNLVNGVLRKYEYLLFQAAGLIKDKTSLKLKLILAMALYERFFLKQPDYVVNNEYVKLGSDRYERSFINAVLHQTDRWQETDDQAVSSCLPEWIFHLLKSQYGDDLSRIIKVYQQIPAVYYRLNKHLCSYEDLKGLRIDIIDDELFCSPDNLLNSDEYKRGCFYVQDRNSASLYHHLQLQKGQKLLDMCSAPGSKLFNCLDILDPEDCFANDVHENRVKLIEKMAVKLGFNGIHYSCCDGRKLKEKYDFQFDRILLDAPCSGLGVIGRKPDLKFHIAPADLDDLEKLQWELLLSADKLLKDEGILLYSTCTLNKKENSRLIARFLKQNEQFRLLEEDTIIADEGDMFYYAAVKKVGL